MRYGSHLIATGFALVLGLAMPAYAKAEDLKLGANIGNVPWEFQDASGAFVGFEIDSWVRRRYQQRFPADKAMTDLDRWHELETDNPLLFVILSGGYDPNSKNWAFGTVGTILGFWLKASR
jgi:hypothetical protein